MCELQEEYDQGLGFVAMLLNMSLCAHASVLAMLSDVSVSAATVSGPSPMNDLSGLSFILLAFNLFGKGFQKFHFVSIAWRTGLQ